MVLVGWPIAAASPEVRHVENQAWGNERDEFTFEHMCCYIFAILAKKGVKKRLVCPKDCATIRTVWVCCSAQLSSLGRRKWQLSLT